MRPVFITVIIFLFLQVTCVADALITFQKTFGGLNSDIAYSLVQTLDEGYIIAGYTLSFGQGNRDVYLIRTDVNGDLLWSKTFGAGNTDYAWTVQQTVDGGFIIGAHTGSFGAGSHDIYLIKCNLAGVLMWTHVYGGSSADGAYSLQQTSDSGFIISAHTSSIGAGQHDVYLIKTNIDGDTVWTRSYGGSGGDYLRSVQQTNDGGYISVAETFSFGEGSADVYLVKTDSLGNLLWAKTYGGISSDYGYSVKQTSDSGYIVAGYTNSFGAGGYDLYLIKTDALGDLLWSKTYGGVSSDYGYSLSLCQDGGYVIAGYTLSFGTNGELLLIRTDSVGNLLWSRTFGGSGADYGWSVQQTIDGGYVIGGYTSSFGAGSNDVYIIKTDEFGNSGCNDADVTVIVGNAATVVNTTATVVSAGATVGATATMTAEPTTIEKVQCTNTNCIPCIGGDVNHSGGAIPLDILDVVYLVDYLFRGGEEPVCIEEADFNASGGPVPIDIIDLTDLVDYLFRGGEGAAGC